MGLVNYTRTFRVGHAPKRLYQPNGVPGYGEYLIRRRGIEEY